MEDVSRHWCLGSSEPTYVEGRVEPEAEQVDAFLTERDTMTKGRN